jgi:hypothetical protein
MFALEMVEKTVNILIGAAEQLLFDPKRRRRELSNSKLWSFVSQKSKRKILNLPVEKSCEA